MSGPNGGVPPLRTVTHKAVGTRTGISNSGTTVQGTRAQGNVFRTEGFSQATAAPPQIQSVQRFTPSVALKRKGVDNNVTGGASIRRARLEDFGGTSDAQLARLRNTPLGTNMAPPQFADSAPDMAHFVAGPEGAPLIGGMPGMWDPYARGVGPVGPRGDSQNISWGGMPQKPDYFDTRNPTPSVNGRLSGTASNSQFINMNGNARVDIGVPNPFENYPWAESSRKVSKTNKTGGPAPRVKFTFTLTQTASRWAALQEAYFPLVGETGHQVAPTPSQKSHGLVAAPRAEANIYDVVVANYLMATEQQRVENFAQVSNGRDLLDKYVFLGAVAAEEGQQKTVRSTHPEITKRRNLAAVLGGEAFNVYNFWGNVPYGAEVGWIFKRVPRTMIWSTNARNAGSYNLEGDNPNKIHILTSEVAHNIFQFIPWYAKNCNDARPSLAELLYVDDFGVEGVGVYIPFGVMLQLHDDLGNADMIDRAWCSKSAAMSAGSIALIVSRKECHY